MCRHWVGERYKAEPCTSVSFLHNSLFVPFMHKSLFHAQHSLSSQQSRPCTTVPSLHNSLFVAQQSLCCTTVSFFLSLSTPFFQLCKTSSDAKRSAGKVFMHAWIKHAMCGGSGKGGDSLLSTTVGDDDSLCLLMMTDRGRQAFRNRRLDIEYHTRI